MIRNSRDEHTVKLALGKEPLPAICVLNNYFESLPVQFHLTFLNGHLYWAINLLGPLSDQELCCFLKQTRQHEVVLDCPGEQKSRGPDLTNQ